MGKSNHLLDGIDRTQHIGNMRHTDNLRTFGEQLLYSSNKSSPLSFIGITLMVIPRLAASSCQGNDVAMVFHHRKNHLIPLLHKFLTKAGDKQIDTLRRSTGKDNLIRAAGIDETSHRLAA